GCTSSRPLSEPSTAAAMVDGLSICCGGCLNAGMRRSRRKNKTRSENVLKALWSSRYPDGLRKCRGGHMARLDEFHRTAAAPDGLSVYCRACQSERDAARRSREVEPPRARQGVGLHR